MHKLGTYLINLLICNNIHLCYNQMKHDFALQIFDIIFVFEYFNVVIYTKKIIVGRIIVYIVNRIIILLRISTKKVIFDI